MMGWIKFAGVAVGAMALGYLIAIIERSLAINMRFMLIP